MNIPSNGIFFNIIEEKAHTLFKNDKISQKLIKKYITSKRNSRFSWGILFLYLRSIHLCDLKENVQTTDIQLATNIELFIISTDILDDLMDKDSSLLTYSQTDYEASRQIVGKTMLSLKKNLKKTKIWLVFKHNLKSSLNNQLLDLQNTINKKSTEVEYYTTGVNKSVYLVNAITQLAWEEETPKASSFSKYFSMANQINNDISNFSSIAPSDVTQFKATLPIVVAVTRISSEAISKYFFEKDANYYDDVCKCITGSGAIEYCRYVSNECYNKAYKSLDKLFPNAKSQIHAFKDYLKG
ncbi:MAG: class 1 isoprenoid biosynthesis enzyme [Lactococcus lactis]|nr:class 1 isoprenoid biosynthesis enzyme [Lactococcus lactis]